ncbi:unnamed protein product [Brassica rapa subsp. narinosa]
MERGRYRGGRGRDGRGRGGGDRGRGYGAGGGGDRGRGYGTRGGDFGNRGQSSGGSGGGYDRNQEEVRSQSQWGPPPGHGGRGAQSQQQAVQQPPQAQVSQPGGVGRGAWGRKPQISSDTAAAVPPSSPSTVSVSETARGMQNKT